MDAKFYIKNLNKSSNNNSQPAQHNYIRFNLQRDFDEITDEEKEKILEFHENGTLFDVIFIAFNGTGVQSRIIADDIEAQDFIVVWCGADSEIKKVYVV